MSDLYDTYVNKCILQPYKGPRLPFYHEYKNIVTIVRRDSNTIIFMKLNAVAMQLFKHTFGGTACNMDEWRYFRITLADAIKTTHSDPKIYESIKIKEIQNPLNY